MIAWKHFPMQTFYKATHDKLRKHHMFKKINITNVKKPYNVNVESVLEYKPN